MTNDATTAQRIKHLLVDKLHLEGLTPDGIADDMPLFGEGLGLDSVDALELVVALEKEFALRIQSHEVGREAFASVAALAAYVDGRLGATADPHAAG
jgi:acyl carrier protein